MLLCVLAGIAYACFVLCRAKKGSAGMKSGGPPGTGQLSNRTTNPLSEGPVIAMAAAKAATETGDATTSGTSGPQPPPQGAPAV